MPIDYLDREKSFTDSEFKKLPRHSNGDIIDLSTAFIWITTPQLELITEDDISRCWDYKEDLECLIAGFQ